MANSSSSTSAFVSSFIFNGCIAAIFTLAFLTLRGRERRIYEPRTLASVRTVKEKERTQRVPSGYFRWVPFLLSRPHSFLIQHTSLDGYFYLRYVSLGVGFSILGIILLYPILLPVNATNGRNFPGFELLSFANVTNKNRFFAHVFLSWIYFGIIVLTIHRELYYYITIRHALQTTPMYDSMLSSRILMITELHSEILDKQTILDAFPKAEHVTFAHDEKQLEKLIKERSKSAKKLEAALNKCLNKCVKLKHKADEKVGVPELDGDILDDYITEKKRPKRRLGIWKIPFLGKKVDIINYDSKNIGELNEDIYDLQNNWDETKILPVCFVRFPSQLEAQEAYQTIKYNNLKGLYGRILTGILNENITWGNMELSKPVRKSKRIGANSFLILMIIFWALPVAVVGCISNITFLTSKVHFLRFIDRCPDVLLGLITGILPSVALSTLMSLVPPIIMFAGKKSGSITVQETDLYCQTWYFAFQVVQVFLVTTCTSSASATVDAIIQEPLSAMTLLANNLPKSSNFYISYFLLQGLSVSSGTLLQLSTLVLSKFIGRILDSTPRKKWDRYCTLSRPTMGIMYPVMELLVVIVLCYSIIAPLILIFSGLCFSLMYLTYIYTLNYVEGFNFDNKGRNYPRALFQIFCGLYLSQICLIGLFIMAKTWGPLVLEVIALIATIFAQVWLKRRFLPLIERVPLSAIRYTYGDESAHYPSDQGRHEFKHAITDELREEDEEKEEEISGIQTDADVKIEKTVTNGNDSDKNSFKYYRQPNDSTSSENLEKNEASTCYRDLGKDNFDQEHFESIHIDTPVQEESFTDNNDIPLSFKSQLSNPLDMFSDEKEMSTPKEATTISFRKRMVRGWGPEISKSWREWITLFFRPSKYYTFEEVRSRLPMSLQCTIKYEDSTLSRAYTDPSVVEKNPMIWICEDPMGISKRQIVLAQEAGADVTDENTAYDSKCRAQYTGDPPDFKI